MADLWAYFAQELEYYGWRYTRFREVPRQILLEHKDGRGFTLHGNSLELLRAFLLGLEAGAHAPGCDGVHGGRDPDGPNLPCLCREHQG